MSVTKHTIEVLLQKANLDLSPDQIRAFEEQFTPLAEEWLKEHGMVPFTLTEAWLKGFVAAFRCQAEDAVEYVLATINRELREKNAELEKERDDIAQLCDPAGIVNENTLLKDQAAALAAGNREFQIRYDARAADYADLQTRHINMHKKHDDLTDKMAELVAINEALEHRLGDPE